MKCKKCGREYEQWYKSGPGLLDVPENNLCLDCNEKAWKDWEVRHKDELDEIKKIQEQGHPHHCACRQVWGDGECECDLYKKGYNPYAWMERCLKNEMA